MGHRETFIGALSGPARAALAGLADLDALLAAHLAAAHAAWPGVHVGDEDFLAHLASRQPDDVSEAELRDVRAADVYLALACAGGDAQAMARFESSYFGEVDVAAARTRSGATLADEVKQILRRILFVAEAGRPAATREFAGRGDLRGWIRVAATRELLRLGARDKRDVHIGDEALFDFLSPADDPELGYIRDLYRRECAEAFRVALGTVPARERSLLRYQLIEGLGIDEIGSLHGVHRATAARWLAQARTQLLERTRAEVVARLGIAPGEVDSILRLVHSRLDVSMERALQSKP
jgi:RNA polymerase sigma-70 factor (ECF subfamily)